MQNKILIKKIIRLVIVSLSILSVFWLVYLLYQSFDEIKSSIKHLEYRWLWVVVIGNCIATYIVFECFRMIFESVQPKTYSRKFLAHVFFMAQLMKHLPGRVIGVAYQANIGNKISTSKWVGINAAYMLMSTAFAIWVACTIAGLMLNTVIGVGVILIGLVIYFICWQPTIIYKLSSYFHNKNITFIATAIDIFASLASSNRAFQIKILVIYVISWLIYLLAWAGYGIAWPNLTAIDGIWLCGIYTLAWFLGYISFVSPSGLGVREAAFIFLAKDFPPDAVTGMAILGRSTLLLVDLILGAIFIKAKRNENT